MGAHPNSKFVIRLKKKEHKSTKICVCFKKRKKQTLSLLKVYLLPAQFWDPLYYLPGTPLALIGRRGFCPFDQISYRHVFVGCFRPRFGVVVPKIAFAKKTNITYKLLHGKR